ncbi:MAG: hypothetical protein N2039_01075 [Gemmataceae bacterium]|nr:hypothetical protein [Gemmataceae bacterium]
MSLPTEHDLHDPDHLIYAGLLGFAAIAVIELSDTTAWSEGLQVAFVAFALAIPLLVVGWVEAQTRSVSGSQAMFGWRARAGWLGSLLVFVGLLAVLWHFAAALAIGFVVLSAILFLLSRLR